MYQPNIWESIEYSCDMKFSSTFLIFEIYSIRMVLKTVSNEYENACTCQKCGFKILKYKISTYKSSNFLSETSSEAYLKYKKIVLIIILKIFSVCSFYSQN